MSKLDAVILLEALLQGRNVAGAHISYESRKTMESDLRFRNLTKDQIEMLDNLTDPPKNS
jgi:hypothetical protein